MKQQLKDLKTLLLLGSCLLLAACTGRTSKASGSEEAKPVITVTIEPQRYFTEAIAGDKFTVVSMVPKGSSPETYDPIPQQLVSLGDSKAYLRIGYIGFEQTWMDRLMNNTPHIQVFDTSKGIDLILNNGEHNHAAGHHDHDGHNHAVEPHIWNSTANALILAGNTFKALCMLDKPNEAYYLARYDSLCQRIQHTDSLIRRQLSAPESAKAFMIYHPALSYFARDYGLHQISIEEGGKEPSPERTDRPVQIGESKRHLRPTGVRQAQRGNHRTANRHKGSPHQPVKLRLGNGNAERSQSSHTYGPRITTGLHSVNDRMIHKRSNSPNMKPIIEIKNLAAGYDGRTVLHDINLNIYERDFLGIIGPNGGGKTTLIKCILGLLKPTAGEIIFHAPTEASSHSQLSTSNSPLSLGYLPQYNTIDRKFPISVEEVILSGLSIQKSLTSRFTPEQREKGKHIIARMGLEGLEHRSIGQLSGGQLQRALLGRAIISDPSVLILDEPSTYIDKRFEARLYELLAEINKECAIILVSHDIGTVLQQVKSIACVNETLDYHPDTGVSTEWLERNFNCPIELLGHGTLPHRVLGEHHHHH